MINFILWIVLGGLAGWIASKIMHTDAQMGAFLNIIVGIIGALIGGYLVNLLFGASVEEFSIGGFITAIIGSVILLAIVKALTGNGRRHVTQ